MTILTANVLTLADWSKRRDPDGKSATIIELLSQANEIIDDMLVLEANGPSSHKTTVRTGIPSATWRMMNQGVDSAKSTTAQITDTIGMLETFATCDKALAELQGDVAEFRLMEALSFIEGMSQQMAQGVIYSNALSTPAQIMGLAPRFSTVTAATAASAANVIDAGGVGATNTSLWLVVWGPNTVHATFPKGSRQVGLTHVDLGDKYAPATDASSKPYLAYWDHFKWDLGLCVRDWRYVVRIANVDVPSLLAGTGVNLINAMIRAVHRPPTLPRRVAPVQKTDAPQGGQMTMGRAAIYCNRTVSTYLDIQAQAKSNVLLRMEEWDSGPVTAFRGIPIRTVDQILNTEARVV